MGMGGGGCPGVVTPPVMVPAPTWGLASTVATQELAQLWCSLSPNKHCLYWYILIHTG